MKRLGFAAGTGGALVLCAVALGGEPATPAVPPPPAGQNPATNAPTALPTVTVVGGLDKAREQIAPELGAVAYTMGQIQIQSTSQGENAPFQQLLLHAPGVVQDEFGEEHIRGDHGDVQYRINGVLLPESLNGFAQEIDPHMIKSVTLLTGTLPAQFGDRTAGIIDVTSKTGAELNGSDFSMYGGSYETIHPSAVFGGATSNLDYFISLSYLHDNLGIDNTTDRNTPLHDLTNQEKAFGYFSHLLDSTSRLTLLTSASYADFEIPNTPGLAPHYALTNSPPANSSLTNERQSEQNYYAVLSYQKVTDNFSGQISAFSRYAEIRFSPDPVQDLLFNGVAGSVDNNDWANGVQLDAEYILNENHTIRGGFLVNCEMERLNTDAQVFPSSSQFSPSGTGEQLPTAGSPQSSTTPESIVAGARNNGVISGVYLQDSWLLYDHLTLNYGLRYDRFDVSFDHEDQISPRVNLVWQANPATSAHLGYARYFMPTTLQYLPPSYLRAFEYTTDAPFNNRDDPQKVERDNYVDAGISRRILPGWSVTGDAFCKIARNLLDDGQFGSAVILNNFNYEKGLVYGSELSSTYTTGPLSAFANFSFVQTDAKDIDSVQGEFSNNELSYLTTNSFQLDHQGKFTGSGGLSYILFKNTLLHSDFLYGNGLRAGFANLYKLPDYWTANAGLEYIWRLHRSGIRELRFRFDCLNVFNQISELRNGTGIGIASAAYMPRRSFYGGVTVVF